MVLSKHPSAGWTLLALSILASACAHQRQAVERVEPGSTAPQRTRALGDYPTPVLLVGIDGFRYDYLDVFEPPNLLAIAANGARAERLVPSFPSKTFPNHYTLVTGLVPDNHGIVSNNIVDPKLGKFSLGNRDAVSDGRWWGGEPVWTTAQNNGLPSAALFWPGSEAEINGDRPDFWLPYDDDLPGADRLDKIIEWLALPEAERPRFLTLYFSRVDSASHRYGPLSHQARTAVMEVDALLGELNVRLEAMSQPIHWVIVSDHGMAETAPDRVIMVDDYVDLDQYHLIDTSPVLAIAPNTDHEASPGWEDRLVSSLRRSPHLEAYRKKDLPKHLRHGSNDRVAPVLALANDGWRFALRAREGSRPQVRLGGQHGYDPTIDSMGALFVASGPRILPGELGPIQNVDVYSLLCELLGVEPATNDGSLDALAPILRSRD